MLNESIPIHFAPATDPIELGDRVHVDGRGLGYVAGTRPDGLVVHVELDTKSGARLGSLDFLTGGGSRNDTISVKSEWVRKVLPGPEPTPEPEVNREVPGPDGEI